MKIQSPTEALAPKVLGLPLAVLALAGAVSCKTAGPPAAVDTTPPAAVDTTPPAAVDTTPPAAVDTTPPAAVDTTPADTGSAGDDRHFYALALLQTARLHLVKGELNQGKAFLARALEVNPALDTLGARALDMMYPDFPQVELPKVGYRYGPVRFSNDGRHLAYFASDQVTYADAESGETVSLGPNGDLRARIEVSPSDRYLLISGQNARYALYDVEEGRLVGRVALWGEESDRGSGALPIAVFSPDETEVAIFHHEATDDAVQFRRTASFDTVAETMPIGRQIYSLLYAPQTGHMIVGEYNRVTLRDRLTREVVRSWPARGRVFSLALSPDGKRLAAGVSREVHVYDLESGELVRQFYACAHNVTRVGFLHGDRFVAWTSPNFQSGLFEVRSGRRIQDFPFGDDMDLSAKRQMMVTGGRFVDLARLDELEELEDAGETLEPPRSKPLGLEPLDDLPPAVEAELRELDERDDYLTSIREKWMSASGRRIAYSTRGGHVLVYQGETERLELFTSDYRITRLLSFVDGEDQLLRLGVSGNGMVGVIEVIDLESGETREKLMRDPPASLALSPDERFAAVIDEVRRLWLFRLDDVENPALLLERTAMPREARFSPDGETLAIRTGERWRKVDVRRLQRKPLPGETRYGFRIEGVELRSGRF